MLDHFKDYNDIVGDHPLNLLTTCLALNAYMLAARGQVQALAARIRRCLARADDRQRRHHPDQHRPGRQDRRRLPAASGTAASTAGASRVKVPQTGELAHRNVHAAGFLGFMNAYLLTGDDRYLDVWRKQIDAVNAQQKTIDGKTMVPTCTATRAGTNTSPRSMTRTRKRYTYLSMKAEDRARVPADGWLTYLDGKDADYPEKALRRDLERVRKQVEAIRQDTTTPDTRLADDPLPFNPASVTAMVELMMGGLNSYPKHAGSVLFCRLRYFDPVRRRAGLPEDVAALIEKMTADQATLTLVNVSQLAPRTVVVQAGGYGEHTVTAVTVGANKVPVEAASFAVRLAPGAGVRLVLQMQRYVNPPTLAFPWDRGKVVAAE